MSKKLLAFFSIASYFLLSNACTIGAAASVYAPSRASAVESASKPSHSRRDHDSDHCCGDLAYKTPVLLSAGPVLIHLSLFAAPFTAIAAAGLPAKYIVSVRRDHGPPGLAAQNPVLSPQGSRAPPASAVL